MQEHEIVSAIRESTGIDTPEHAEQATRATLKVLGQRLAGGEPGDLAAQLPSGLAGVLPERGPGERFEVEEFYRRVAKEEGHGCTPTQARQHARAVFATLKNGLAGGEFDDLVAQLPGGYDDVIGAGPVQH